MQDSPIYAYLPAENLERARAFYEHTLGFVPTQQTNGGVVCAFGKQTAAFLYLYPTPNAGTSRASQAFWDVVDVDGEIEASEARGVVFETYDGMPGERSASGAVTAGGAKAAWFKDSEGDTLALIQNLSAPRADREPLNRL